MSNVNYKNRFDKEILVFYTKSMKKINLKQKLLSHHSIIVVSMILGCVFWDLFTKTITEGYEVSILNKIISFYSVHNTGAAWSIFSNQTLVLSIVSGIAIVGIIIYDIFFNTMEGKLYSISLALILSGAIGNFIDRVFFGYVRDFIRLDFINFPIFNLADIFLVSGCIGICIFMIIFACKESNKKTQKPKKDISEND